MSCVADALHSSNLPPPQRTDRSRAADRQETVIRTMIYLASPRWHSDAHPRFYPFLFASAPIGAKGEKRESHVKKKRQRATGTRAELSTREQKTRAKRSASRKQGHKKNTQDPSRRRSLQLSRTDLLWGPWRCSAGDGTNRQRPYCRRILSLISFLALKGAIFHVSPTSLVLGIKL